MGSLFRNADYTRLFAAQVIALSGTGLMTVALSLLAFDLAGPRAGAVLGLLYTIKMVAFVGLSPFAQAWAARLPRKAVLIGADIVRALAALSLPFVTQIWQVCLLVFILQAASATFTPAYQATLPDLLPDEKEYTRALSLSRLAYDLENLTSPALAGILLSVITFNWLFMGTVLGFAGSAILVAMTVFPSTDQRASHRPFLDRLTAGTRLFLATPRLRGLLALSFCASWVGAFVLVNTVVLVRQEYGADTQALALAMGCFGLGSMIAALALPRLLEAQSDRPVMMGAALGLAVVALVSGLVFSLTGWPNVVLALALLVLGGGLYSAIITPAGRLMTRSSTTDERPAVFAAYFALSHAGWLVAYPLAGWAGLVLGLPQALTLLGVLGLASVVTARRLWPRAQSTVPKPQSLS